MLIALFVMCTSVLVHAVQLTIHSHEGMPLKKAGVGVPFLLKCTVSYDGGSSMQEPLLEGMHDMVVHRTGFHINTINNNSHATYTYQVRARKPGTYTLGPVRFVHNGKTQTSNTVSVVVDAHEEVDTQQVNNQNKGNAFARLLVDKDELYIGEKMHYAIRLYYLDSSTDVEHIIRPQLESFKIADQQQAHAGQEKIKDTVYQFKEWSWDIYPTQVGELIIEPHRVDFTQEESRSRSSRFHVFWGPQVERKRIYTNSASINVMPLPPYDGAVIGIGSCNQLRATIEPGLAKEGEAMVLTLALEGVGHMDDMQFPTIEGLPDCFKSYPSQQYTQKDQKSGTATKYFECIVQGMKAGNWEIPSQSCTYFDTAARQYKTMKTTPLSVTILPSVHAARVSPQQELSVASTQEINDMLYPLVTTYDQCATTERSVPLWLFVCISILPWLCIVGYMCGRYIYARYIHNRVASRKYHIKQAERLLHEAQKEQDVSKVYPLFTALIGGLHNIPPTVVTQEYMYTIFDNSEWHCFVDRAAEYAFYTPMTDTTMFFKEGLVWLECLAKQ